MTLGLGVCILPAPCASRIFIPGPVQPRATTSREVHIGHSGGVGRLAFMFPILTAQQKAPPDRSSGAAELGRNLSAHLLVSRWLLLYTRPRIVRTRTKSARSRRWPTTATSRLPSARLIWRSTGSPRRGLRSTASRRTSSSSSRRSPAAKRSPSASSPCGCRPIPAPCGRCWSYWNSGNSSNGKHIRPTPAREPLRSRPRENERFVNCGPQANRSVRRCSARFSREKCKCWPRFWGESPRH